MLWKIKELNSNNFDIILKDCLISRNNPIFSSLVSEIEVSFRDKEIRLMDIKSIIKTNRFLGTERYDNLISEFIPNTISTIFCYQSDKDKMIKEYYILTNGVFVILIDWIHKIKILNGSYDFFNNGGVKDHG